MAELANCSRCDGVFVKGIRDVCQECFKEEERLFETVYTFLKQRKNREATIIEIVEATEVEESLIIKFIRQKRLRNSDFPNLSYPCERCDTPIVSRNLCDECSRFLIESFSDCKAETQEKNEESAPVYFSYKTK